MAEFYSRKRKKVCPICAGKEFDYKDEFIKKFISDKGKIVPRRVSGACAKHQRYIAGEVKKARFMGLAPYTN